MMRLLRRLIPKSLLNVAWHLPRAVIAACAFGFPARKLTCIAIAGTKGKTTATILTARMLAAAGHRVACVSTAVVRMGGAEAPNTLKITTPSAWWLQRFLRDAVAAGCTHAALEVSSHALLQHRVFGIPFAVVVLTNLMPDHLEYHRDAREYQTTHLRLARRGLRALVVNADDSNCAMFRSITRVPVRTFAFAGSLAERIRAIPLALFGEFNVANALAAATAAEVVGVPWDAVASALRDPAPIPGRLERIDAGQPFTAIVDYAHSPDSLRCLFDAVAALHPKRIITVFGACGERDPVKRPEMGAILDARADVIIVTNDDPYGEDPEAIARGLRAGITKKREGDTVYQILDRRQAIEKAVALATSDDLVLVLGKGVEQWQVFKDRRVPWDDRAVIREAISARGK